MFRLLVVTKDRFYTVNYPTLEALLRSLPKQDKVIEAFAFSPDGLITTENFEQYLSALPESLVA